jgi:hypothetical protein
MRARVCGVVRRQLSAYHDGELAVAEQIAVEDHLRECIACRIEADELRSLSSLLHAGSPAAGLPARIVEMDAFASNVVSRMKAERDESFVGQTQRLFEDLHLLWAALGATGAAVACVAVLFTLFYFGATQRPDSLDAIIGTMASPIGSDRNPLAHTDDNTLRLPSAVDAAFPEAVTNEEDAVFALAAVVTREGSLKNLNLLESSQERHDVEALLDRISKARFEPARYGDSPVAVNMVWLYAHVNVRGKVPAGSRLQTTPPTVISAVVEEGIKAV